MIDEGEEIPTPKSLNYYVQQTDDISNEDILAHVNIEIPESVLA